MDIKKIHISNNLMKYNHSIKDYTYFLVADDTGMCRDKFKASMSEGKLQNNFKVKSQSLKIKNVHSNKNNMQEMRKTVLFLAH